MDIVSPLYTEEAVTDYDFVYIGGCVDQLTIRKGDEVSLGDRFFSFKIAKPAEEIFVVLANILSYRIRERVIRWPLKEPIVGALSQNP